MDRYLLQLQTDIRQAALLAPSFEEFDPFDNLDEEAPLYEAANLQFSLPVLFDIPIEAFPPSSLLTEKQTEVLVDEISKLWSAWRLYWDMPPDLSIPQAYSAMLRAMKEESVNWQLKLGGVVKICQYETKGYCPHGDGGSCYCQKVNEAAKHDLEVWEEHVRSQGIDPSEELTEETGAAFQAESKRRAYLKRHEEEWSELWLDELMDKEEGNKSLSFNEYLDFEENDGWTGFFLLEENETQADPNPELNDPSNDLLNEDFHEMST